MNHLIVGWTLLVLRHTLSVLILACINSKEASEKNILVNLYLI